MSGAMLPKWTVYTTILVALSGAALIAAPADGPQPMEAVAPPPPQMSFQPGPAALQRPAECIFQRPTVTENTQPPPLDLAQPTPADQILPINLPTALCLSNARPLVIAFAQASVEEAAALLQRAQVLWLPNLNVGADYYRHDGLDQATDGTIIDVNKYSVAAGGGATLNFAVTDAIFAPLAARQALAARESDLQAARNNALLQVATAYFDVQQSRGRLAGTLDAVMKAEGLVKQTAGLARGLVPEIEVDRARALQFDLQQQMARARADWRVTSARLTRVLRLNPGAVVVPLEPPHLQVTLITPDRQVAELIPVGLRGRPELASRQALVQVAMERVRQEQVRPFVPNVVMGGAGPGGAFGGDVFGGGPDNGNHLYGGRFDMEVAAIWTLENLGAGNRSLVHQRVAQEHQAAIDFADVQDQVAEEVVQAHAQVEAAAVQVAQTAGAVKEALTTYNGTLQGLRETRGSGDLLYLVNRPQEAVAALQQLNRAYDIFYVAVNDYNRRSSGCIGRWVFLLGP